MAAEIALAEIAERSPTYLKQGLATIDGAGLRPHQITELAGAIGTVDLLEGNRKRSRRLFSKSMTDPNGNALAQGEWAAASLGAEIIPSMSLSTVPEAGEAKALHLYRGSRFQQAVGVCEEWMESDPFSLRPYEFASTAAGLVEDYENALSFANRGMELRLSAPLLLGAAFALASTGRLEEAAAKLDLVDESEGDRIPYVVSANRGLIAFRRGEPSEGRRLYMEAIEGFKKINVPALSAKARVYLAREALLANEPDADALLSLAKSAVATSGGFEANAVLAIIEQRRGGGGGEPKSDRPEALSKKPLDPRDISWTAPGLATPYRNDLPDNRPPASSRPKGNNR